MNWNYQPGQKHRAVDVRIRMSSMSSACAMKFLEEENVAVVPGTAFGDSGEGFLRITYAYSIDNLKVAMEKLKKFVNRL